MGVFAPVLNGGSLRPKWSDGPMAGESNVRQSPRHGERTRNRQRIRPRRTPEPCAGYRVEAAEVIAVAEQAPVPAHALAGLAGPVAHGGRVQGVPHAGRPPQPLVLIVSDGATVRFVSLRRVAAVLPLEQSIVLRPRQVPSVSFARAAPGRKAA